MNRGHHAGPEPGVGEPEGMPPEGIPPPDGMPQGGIRLSLVKGDGAWRLQRYLHLMPAHGMAAGRRALFFAALTWLPLMLGAWWARQHGQAAPEALLGHYGVHARCLLAIPLMILAEGIGHRLLPRTLEHFELAGLVRHADRESFHAMLNGVAGLRNRLLPWVLILGLVLAWCTTAGVQGKFSDVDLKLDPRALGQNITFAHWWFAAVVRPIFFAMLLAWLWRTLLLAILMRRLARFPLCLVPAHPDRRAGLGLIERLAFIFSPVAFALSAVVAASFAYDVVMRGVNVLDIKFELVGTAILVALLFLLPFMPLSWLLFKAKREAMHHYGALLSHHGRLVYRRWILGERVKDDPILDAPEIGPSADIQTMYHAVAAMRVLSVDKLGLAAICVPAALPVAAVALIQIPFAEVIGRVVKAVM